MMVAKKKKNTKSRLKEGKMVHDNSSNGKDVLVLLRRVEVEVDVLFSLRRVRLREFVLAHVELVIILGDTGTSEGYQAYV